MKSNNTYHIHTFARMLVMALASGITFSALALCITLLLTTPSYADATGLAMNTHGANLLLGALLLSVATLVLLITDRRTMAKLRVKACSPQRITTRPSKRAL